ncbi:hypothetical protein [Pseudarthrobacter sp. NPDC058119]|uniref:hypothetical protein n=1 Tax=Pseudarthrobacter sp. NPDC058119 TaxID=3346348 RepID=UPI0036DA0DFE
MSEVAWDRDDWAHLVGGVVEVRLNGQLVRVGRMEQTTPDSSMMWVAADAVEQRTLYMKAWGYKVRLSIPVRPNSGTAEPCNHRCACGNPAVAPI